MFKSTTILSVRRNDEVAIAGDGQVTLNDAIVKHGSNKVQKIEKIENKKVKYQVLVGFAGAAADAMSLFEKLEGKLDEHRGDLRRAAVELAKDWRSDRVLRRLDAMLAAADAKNSFLISGTGDLIAPDDGILAVGSGGTMALAAARALMKHTELSASDIIKEAMDITSDIHAFFTFLINVKLDSIIIVYLNAIVILGLFGYSVWRLDAMKILRNSLIIGAIAATTYLLFDNLFGNLKYVGLITYLKRDLLLGITPLHIFLNWICIITILLYFYQRLRSLFDKVYFPMLLTSIAAVVGNIILSILGNYARIWLWNTTDYAPPPFIGSLPLFVPTGLFLTFLFSPYFVPKEFFKKAEFGGKDNPTRFSGYILAGGIRCGVTLGIMQFLCFAAFRYFQ